MIISSRTYNTYFCYYNIILSLLYVCTRGRIRELFGGWGHESQIIMICKIPRKRIKCPKKLWGEFEAQKQNSRMLVIDPFFVISLFCCLSLSFSNINLVEITYFLLRSHAVLVLKSEITRSNLRSHIVPGAGSEITYWSSTMNEFRYFYYLYFHLNFFSYSFFQNFSC